MSNGRATDAQFDALHGLLTEAMIAQLAEYRRPKLNPETGVLEPGEIPAAFLGQCLKFLKDNGVDSPARAAGLRDRLADRMPTFEDEDAMLAGGRH